MKTDLTLISIELTKLCNMKCVMCVSHGAGLYKGQADKQPNFMDKLLFKDIIHQYKKLQPNWDSRSVIPQFQGEPTIHKNFIEYCEICEKEDMQFSFTTNALKLDKYVVDELVKMKNFRGLTVSIDGFYKDTYEKIRKIGSFDTVVENSKYAFHQLAKENLNRKYNTINTGLSFTHQPLNKDELQLFVDQWIGYTNHININNVAIDGKPSFYNHAMSNYRDPCGDLWHFMIILTDGKVVPCCRDDKYEMDMGNINSNSLEEIWFGKKYTEMRKAHLEQNFSKLPLCNNCDTWACRTAKRKTIDNERYVREEGPFFATYRPKQLKDVDFIIGEDQFDGQFVTSLISRNPQNVNIILHNNRVDVPEKLDTKFSGIDVWLTPTLVLSQNHNFLDKLIKNKEIFCSNFLEKYLRTKYPDNKNG